MMMSRQNYNDARKNNMCGKTYKIYKAIDIAHWFVKKAEHEGFTDMTHLRLQKMIYIAHGWMLGLEERRFIDEDVEAWPYGPVIPVLYNQLRFHGNTHITLKDLEKLSYKFDDDFGDDESFLTKIYDVYSKPFGSALIEITHEQGTPWHTATGGRFLDKCIIPVEIIKEYYKRKSIENQKAQA